jgi:threonine/homoserine/homoserine lactone efflux protein
MDYQLFLKGLILGFSVSAPIGPIGILCINRTLNKNFVSGMVSGLGAASADFIYAIIAGFGLTFISDFIIRQKLWFQIGGLVLITYVGIRSILIKRKNGISAENGSKGLLNDYLSTFVLTITNPGAILLFLALFAGLGISVESDGFGSALLLVAGVFIGANFWWLFLSWISDKFRKKLNDTYLRKVDLISGISILAIGLVILINVIIQLSR